MFEVKYLKAELHPSAPEDNEDEIEALGITDKEVTKLV